MKRIFAFAALALGLMATGAHAQAATHEVDLKIVNPNCTTASVCTAVLYRATASCPTDGSITGLTASMSTQVANPAITLTSTTWVYQDKDPLLTAGVTYCYWSIESPSSGGAAYPTTNTFQGTIPQAKGTLTGTVIN